MDKRCRDCGVVKPITDFYEHAGCRDGRRPECKACNLADKARRSAANPEPARERARRWRESPDNRAKTAANHERYREDGRKKKSDRRSYLKRTYGITLEDYDAMLEAQAGRCAICRRLLETTSASTSTTTTRAVSFGGCSASRAT